VDLPPDRPSKEAVSSSGTTARLLPIYYVLAAFSVFTVAMSLYLNHNIMAIYTDSVDVNRQWAERLTQYSELGQLAAAVDTPPNDVFDSHDAASETRTARSSRSTTPENRSSRHRRAR
jgi:hypothetical protein